MSVKSTLTKFVIGLAGRIEALEQMAHDHSEFEAQDLSERVDHLTGDFINLAARVDHLDGRVDELETDNVELVDHVVRDLDEVIIVEDEHLIDNVARIEDGVLYVGAQFLELFDEAIEAAAE